MLGYGLPTETCEQPNEFDGALDETRPLQGCAQPFAERDLFIIHHLTLGRCTPTLESSDLYDIKLFVSVLIDNDQEGDDATSGETSIQARAHRYQAGPQPRRNCARHGWTQRHIRKGGIGMSPHSPPVHAALDYCARKLLIELECSPGVRHASILAHRLTPTTIGLLRWWFAADACKTRVHNFHAGQRQAIVHTVLAHELLQSDDPAWLYRMACDPARAWADAPLGPASPVQYAGYVLQMAPGSGLRWVTQALLVWQWANHIAAQAAARSDSRFSGEFVLLAANTAVRRRLQDALFGPEDVCGQRDAAQSSLIRHVHLFVPPALRAAWSDWLYTDARCTEGNRTLQVVDVLAEASETVPPITLVAGVGARMLGGGELRRGLIDHAPPQQVSLLWIDLTLSQAPNTLCPGSTPIAEFPLERAIRHGVVKLPLLEPTQQLRLPALRKRLPRRTGLRPRLSRAHRSLLKMGLDALSRRHAGFVALHPARRPKLLVLCDMPQLIRGVLRTLISFGMDKADLAERTVIDTFSARATLTDPRICVTVVLRSCITARAPVAVLTPGLAPLWPEPEFAALCGENREHAILGRAPTNLLDVLSIIDHPQCHTDYVDLLCAGLAAHGDHHRKADAIGDLIVTGLRADASVFDIALPCINDSSAAAAHGDDLLTHVPRRILRARQSMPVRKSVYTHAAWSAHDGGLRRAFLECAECDALIESHCLPDPRRHAMHSSDTALAQGVSLLGVPDALVRTADAVYLIALLPSCPAQPQPHTAAERALLGWCACVNALPPAQRQQRRWYRVQLYAPLFWSWKRSEGTLSALLSALAGTTPLTRRSHTAAAAD